MLKPRVLSAGYGISSWIYQRLTAIVMLVALLELFIFIFTAHKIMDASFITWQKFFRLTYVKIFSQITFLAVIIHAWVGIRDLWMDYVKAVGLRIVLYTFTCLWLGASFMYSIVILWT